MPLILTGVGMYSTTYLDGSGTERRIKLRQGQDAEALGLPLEVLETLRTLSRKAGHKIIPYFTDVGESAKAKPAAAPPVEEKKAVVKNTTSVAHMNATVKPLPVLPESIVKVEQPEKVEEPVIEEVAVEEPVIEEVAVEEPVIEEVAVEEPVAPEVIEEKPVIEEVTMEEPVAPEVIEEKPKAAPKKKKSQAKKKTAAKKKPQD